MDSSSPSALTASGNAAVKAASIRVHGGVNKSGSATLSPAPITGAPLVSDPLADLSVPSSGSSLGSINVGGNSVTTIYPGTYSQINVSGNAKLTMGAGVYIIAGGGFTVTGNASVTGKGILIYNAGSNVASGTSGTPLYGGIALSGNGSFSLSAPTSGTYAGILIFQARDNTRALSISGNALAAINGATIYAPVAQLAESGNGQLCGSLIVGTLSLSGNVVLTQTAAGTDNSGDLSTVANTLLAGNQYVYINDPNSLFTPDELARIQDAINGLDDLLAPYSVTIAEVTDPTLANLIIDIGSTSAAGTAAQGVLGCETATASTSEITILHDWNWYAGSDPTAVGSNRYDFQTVVTHEIGHALGLGHNSNPSSVMYATLASGTIRRIITVVDLNIPDPPDGEPDPLMAAGFQSSPAGVAVSQNWVAVALGSVKTPGAVGFMALPPAGVGSTQAGSGESVLNASGFTAVAASQASGQWSVVILARQDAARSSDLGFTQFSTDSRARSNASQRPAGPRAQPADSHNLILAAPPTGRVFDSALAELASELGMPGASGIHSDGLLPSVEVSSTPARIDSIPPQVPSGEYAGSTARLADILLAAGFCGLGTGFTAARNSLAKRWSAKRRISQCRPRAQ